MVTALRVTGAVHRFAETLSRSISCLAAIPDGKPFHTFPGIALCLDAIPDGKPFHTFPGIALNPEGARGEYG
ncbi:hypothetical protein [Mesorhizobium sp.]|uniref:hypothetical protein n=1 Tax=Mesorhizobium sp. TaxID=1871066 RepID=UPI0025C6149F|nr:hypothetical protein [Mesorhizobium sp.]